MICCLEIKNYINFFFAKHLIFILDLIKFKFELKNPTQGENAIRKQSIAHKITKTITNVPQIYVISHIGIN